MARVRWNSKLSTRRGKILRDYVDENSCLIFGVLSTTTKPYNTIVATDVLNFVITKNLPFPVSLTSCSPLISDHLPFLIETACCSYCHHQPDRSDCRSTEWFNFQTQLEEVILFELHNEIAIDTCVQNFSTSRKATLLVSYLESYLNDLQRWLSDWTIAINVPKSTAIIFARATRRLIPPRPVTLFGN